jgi:hypothetical protein
MKENSKILMKMSTANELFTTSGNAMRTATPIASQSRPRARNPRVIIVLSPRQDRLA